jgi:hypothetical protein
MQHCGYVHAGSCVPQVPSAPQFALQHSTPLPHDSPNTLQQVGYVQAEGWQVPLQFAVQHSEFPVHASPVTVHGGGPPLVPPLLVPPLLVPPLLVPPLLVPPLLVPPLVVSPLVPLVPPLLPSPPPSPLVPTPLVPPLPEVPPPSGRPSPRSATSSPSLPQPPIEAATVATTDTRRRGSKLLFISTPRRSVLHGTAEAPCSGAP